MTAEDSLHPHVRVVTWSDSFLVLNTSEWVCNNGTPLVSCAQTVFSIRFPASFDHLSCLRAMVRSASAEAFGTRREADRVAMLAQEMLENVVKSSTNPMCQLKVSRDGPSMTVSVESAPSPEHLTRLRAELEQLAHETAESAFLRSVERAMSLPRGESRIGLARMVFEGRVALVLEPRGSDRICLIAKGEVESA